MNARRLGVSTICAMFSRVRSKTSGSSCSSRNCSTSSANACCSGENSKSMRAPRLMLRNLTSRQMSADHTRQRRPPKQLSPLRSVSARLRTTAALAVTLDRRGRGHRNPLDRHRGHRPHIALLRHQQWSRHRRSAVDDDERTGRRQPEPPDVHAGHRLELVGGRADNLQPRVGSSGLWTVERTGATPRRSMATSDQLLPERRRHVDREGFRRLREDAPLYGTVMAAKRGNASGMSRTAANRSSWTSSTVGARSSAPPWDPNRSTCRDTSDGGVTWTGVSRSTFSQSGSPPSTPDAHPSAAKVGHLHVVDVGWSPFWCNAGEPDRRRRLYGAPTAARLGVRSGRSHFRRLRSGVRGDSGSASALL